MKDRGSLQTAPSRKDAPGEVRALRACQGGTGGDQTRNHRLPRLHASVREKPAREIHGPRQDDEEAPAAQPQGCGRMVPTASSRRCGGAAPDPQREDERPLPVLRPPHELPQSVAVLPERARHLEKVAQPPHEGPDAHLGALCPAPASPPARTSPNRTALVRRGESNLKNPLR